LFSGGTAHQVVVRHLIRGNLESGHVGIERFYHSFVERGRKKVDAGACSVFGQSRNPFERHLQIADDVVDRSVDPEVIAGSRAVRVEPIRREYLKLDCVSAGFRRDVDQSRCMVKVPVVIAAGFGNDVDSASFSKRPPSDRD